MFLIWISWRRVSSLKACCLSRFFTVSRSSGSATWESFTNSWQAPLRGARSVLGKALSAGIRSLSQAVIIYLLAFLLGVKMNWTVSGLIGVLATVILGAALFSALSLIIASLVKTRERFMGMGQVLTMPLFFASNAIYPISMMPRWLQIVSHANPLTYQVDALRALMLAHGTSSLGLGLDFSILVVATVIAVVIGAKVYPRVAT